MYAQDATWETVSIPGTGTYQIPPSLEIQAGVYKRFSDKFRRTVLEIETSPDRVVAQPKGINTRDPTAMKRYCRVIVETAQGHYSKLDEPITLSPTELNSHDKERKDEFQQAAIQSATKGMEVKILSWEPSKIVRVNGIDAVVTTFTRTLNNGPPVLVREYTINNNDRFHRITISYRELEKEIWASDLDKILQTFKFKKR